MPPKRRATGTLYRPMVSRIRNGKRERYRSRFWWVRYRDVNGKPQRHALKTAAGHRIEDRETAEEVFVGMLNSITIRAAGLFDPAVEGASYPIRKAVAEYARYKRHRVGRTQLRQAIYSLKYIIEGMAAYADYHEAAIEARLRILVNNGRSARTVNVYRAHAHSFGEWALKIKRIAARNPVAAIPREAEHTPKKERRAITIKEASALIHHSGDRGIFWHLLLWTGLRVNEAMALRWSDVKLHGKKPTIRLRAADTKARRADELPLHPSLVKALKKHRKSHDGDAIFDDAPTLQQLKGRTYIRKGKQVRIVGDLDRAGIPFEDEHGRTFDRHAMRTTFISWLGKYGVDPRAQIALARHTPTGVTMKHYQDFRVFDLWEEIGKLPSPRRPRR